MTSLSASLNSTNVRSSISLAWHRLSLAVATVFAPDHAADAAGRLFTTVPRHGHKASELEMLATGTRFDVPTPEGRLAAWRFGRADAPVVVLNHGWGGRGAQLRSFVPALLAAGYQGVLFDHIGHGLSDGRQASLVHFLNDVDAVVRWLEAQGLTVAGMVAHSLGAAAVAAWLNKTQRRMRVVLLAPPTSLERYAGYFARRLGITESVRSAMQERFERRYGHRWQEFELPHSVSRVRADALVIHDAGDLEVTAASGLALARAWPGAKFVRTEGLGHRVLLRDATVVSDAVDFLQDRVVFAPPPRRGEASAYFAPAPIA